MVKAMEAARKAARQALESTYEGLCTIIEYRSVADEKTKLTSKKEIAVLEGQPCKLSFEKLNATSETETASAATQGVKLFLAPEINIPGGSKLVVTQNGVIGEYSSSGIPAIYETHQEIVLELFERWA